MSRLGTFIQKLSHKDGGFLFLRSQLSSQVASICDNVSAFVLKKFFDIIHIKIIYFFSQGITSYVVATVTGQIIGGTVSCLLNYRWAFKSLDVKIKHVIIKFLLVWLGSVLLNTYFTFILTELLRHTHLVEGLLGDYYADDVFIVVKLLVAIIIGFSWNFQLYKHFVFRNTDTKRFLKKILKPRPNR